MTWYDDPYTKSWYSALSPTKVDTVPFTDEVKG